jgi:hypothetical protein
MPLIYHSHRFTQLDATVSKNILLAVALVCLLRRLFELDFVILEPVRRADILHLFHLFVVFLHFAVRRILGDDVFHCLLDSVDVLLHILGNKVRLDLLVGPSSFDFPV